MPTILGPNSLESHRLEIFGLTNHAPLTHKIRISSKVDETTWNKLKALAADTRQNISDLLAEAIRKYITHKRARPVVLNHLALSIAENETPGKRLAGWPRCIPEPE